MITTFNALSHYGNNFAFAVLNFNLTSQVYISETAPTRLRGSLGAFNQIGIVAGILVSFITGHALSWRWSAMIGTGPPTCMFILMIFMPETVSWLLAHGKEELAEKMLQWLRGPNANVEKEIIEVKYSLGEYISVRKLL